MLVSLGIGIAAALLATLLITALVCLNAHLYSQGQERAKNMMAAQFSNIAAGGSTTQFTSGSIIATFVNILTNATGGANSISLLHGSTPEAAVFARGTFGLPGLALLFGTAFGAYMVSRHIISQKKWEPLASSVIVGVGVGLIYLLLAACFPIRCEIRSDELHILLPYFPLNDPEKTSTLSLVNSSLTWVTFVMPLLTAAIGALIGYALSRRYFENGNVFSACWAWVHRARGAVRTGVEALGIYSLVFFVYSLIMQVLNVIMYTISYHCGTAPIMVFLRNIPSNQLAGWQEGSLGGILMYVSPTSPKTQRLSALYGPGLFGSDKLYAFSALTPERYMRNNPPTMFLNYLLPLVLFLLSTSYIMLRASARSLQDRANAGWAKTWQTPAIAAIFWAVAAVAINLSCVTMKVTQPHPQDPYLLAMYHQFSGDSYTYINDVQPWYTLIGALWMFAIEALALSLGPAMIKSMPGLMGILKGGLVQPSSALVGAENGRQNNFTGKTSKPFTNPDVFIALLKAGRMQTAYGQYGMQTAMNGRPGMAPTDAIPSMQGSAPGYYGQPQVNPYARPNPYSANPPTGNPGMPNPYPEHRVSAAAPANTQDGNSAADANWQQPNTWQQRQYRQPGSQSTGQIPPQNGQPNQ
ncbi:hypothetical protein OZX72_01190 [Bifidobacterium sp. ESL0769]|uniref:hypothetical protein n=1 Tax=Bifidobacterium sp. ESL0769 TaxID=2983229 RepID=UPI0023F72F8A|nr:hypothetical protein [Bifidobacterium sp. ESL0769]WEV67647.1 hypothetical protein OZX72_01190 [Bifidobacterium sp. ESL0769]